MSAGPYSIGSSHWPGLSKLIEEAGEVQQVAGKIIATNGEVEHWDGTNLRLRLEDEIADVVAACTFMVSANGLDADRVAVRIEEKLRTFEKWHREQK